MNFKTLTTALVLTLAAGASLAQAPAWPTKSVRIVTAFGAGSASDIVARMIAEDLQSAFKQPFVVDNKPGTSWILAAAMGADVAPAGAAELGAYMLAQLSVWGRKAQEAGIQPE